MPPGDVVFRYDAETAKAVQGILKFVKAENLAVKGFRKSVVSGKAFDRTLNKVYRTAASFAGGVLSARGLVNSLQKAVANFRNASREAMRFEDEMTGLLSLGENIDNIDKIKGSVLAMSNTFGIARGQIAETMFNLQSGAAGLDKAIQKRILKSTIELVKVTGTDMPVAMNALLKSYRIFGSETMSVERIQAKLFKTAELGYLTFQDMAVLLPDLEAAAKTFGFSMDEVGGAVVTATQKLGRTQVTLTGIRNTFLAMAAAQKKGIPMTDDFVANMEQLSKLEPEFLTRIFGKRTVAVVGVLASNTKKLRDNIQAIKEARIGEVSEKLADRLTDASYALSEAIKGYKQTQKNILATKGKKGLLFEAAYEASKAGYRKLVPTFLHGGKLEEFYATGGALNREGNVFYRKGLEERFKQLQAAGELERYKAEYELMTGNRFPISQVTQTFKRSGGDPASMRPGYRKQMAEWKAGMPAAAVDPKMVKPDSDIGLHQVNIVDLKRL